MGCIQQRQEHIARLQGALFMPAVAAAESHLPIPPVTESFMSPSPPEDVLPEEMIQITFQDTGPLADASGCLCRHALLSLPCSR